MALKLLFFSEKNFIVVTHGGNLFFRTQSSQPTTFEIVITGFLNKEMQ